MLSMMKYPLKIVHGCTLSELEGFLKESCDIFDKSVSLEPTSLGGWSNVNFRGRSSGIEFVLKLPWSTEVFDSNPYNPIYDLSLFFSRLDIASPPLEVGRLPNSSETPFCIVEYIPGTSLPSIGKANENDLLSLKKSHQILKREKPPNIPKYESPFNYFNAIRSPVEEHDWLSKASTETLDILNQYELLLPSVVSSIEIIGYWSGETMHGDLWIPNIIFRSKRNALLLDLEACATGDSRYDLAYLLEAHESASIKEIPLLFEDEDVNFINSLRPLALTSVIDWSITRLLSMESGIVEQNLNTPNIYSMILGYVREKIVRLGFLLH
ncbi:MAG: aminoglycoside phosphotransferase family protein [Candidatus Thorarchaeota archaeon]|nr:MAG: aminoglycoside phosphotransferase family protein [Candidatus Thorarchaeota archaeon]